MKKILLLATFLTITSIGHAQVLGPGQVLILQDTFNRGTPSDLVPLNGTSPSYTVAPETWTAYQTADSTVTTNGSSAIIPGTEAPDGPYYGTTNYIGIPGITGGDLTVGKTYTFQFDVAQAQSGPWTIAGFGTETNTASYPYGGGNYAGLYAFDNGGGIAIGLEGSTIYYNPTVTGNSGSVILSIKVGAVSDILNATVNGIPVVSDYIAPLAPISDVFIGDLNNTSGSFSNLSVTEDVPEPSTWAMLLGGAGALFVVQRLRRKLSV